MSRYAENTLVSTEASLAEIKRTLRRYGVPNDRFLYAESPGYGVVFKFEFRARQYQILLRLPDPQEPRFQRSPSGCNQRTPEQAEAAWDQGCRQCYRALALIIKAKLEAIEAGICSDQEELLAWRVLPTGRTVAETIVPKLADLRPGDVPDLLPMLALPGTGNPDA